MYERGKGSSLPSEQVVRLLLAAARSADVLLAQSAAEGGPGGLHHRVLDTLARFGPHGRADLAVQAGAAEQEVAGAVETLLAEGLATTMVVHVGGRQELLVLAPPGLAALEELRADDERAADALFASLTRGERSQLGHLLRRVCARAEALGVRAKSSAPGPAGP
ncbi:DNA-binding MarR family transcriptional regulator [Kitasatospora sp. SolWspMP-SS2h]|uniref:MarR family winged helix-turn-helix transcriptional regulator n=1 Tax=Kitasatospora sp. SolWspMP-SS2h TaxID=1305729 RepID=UPI000DB923B4|nr:MarR family winged helix-turn-helix transcriptional regulator [Kitasatospora sp. SolWspMP-SS2h]RAJ36793.1 DNA-binding MarR family transcriptional regulator [Kitasatospora sp. SolWspMP-SS2h]